MPSVYESTFYHHTIKTIFTKEKEGVSFVERHFSRYKIKYLHELQNMLYGVEKYKLDKALLFKALDGFNN